jgi:hypothetical protein
VDIFPLRITKAKLDAAPEDERMLYLIAAQCVNELNILSKLSYFMHAPPGREVFKRANMTASMLCFSSWPAK